MNSIFIEFFPFGYPAEERPQQDRFDSARIHWVK